MDAEFTGWDKAANFFKKYTSDVEERFGTYLEILANQIIDEARNNVQNNRSINTGTLLSSIRILENNEGKDILVGTDLPYAIYIEYGRGPIHSHGKPLHFIDKDTGDDVFAMSAKATEPTPFLEPAAIKVLAKAPEIVTKLENKFIEEIQ